MSSNSKEYDREYRRKNKERLAAYQAEYKKRTAPARRAYHRVYNATRRYGITIEQRNSILAQPCGICGGKATDIDHDHSTGKVRGGLCGPCNRSLGGFRDNPELLDKARVYLGSK